MRTDEGGTQWQWVLKRGQLWGLSPATLGYLGTEVGKAHGVGGDPGRRVLKVGEAAWGAYKV